MSIELDRNYYMIRAMGSSEEHFKVFIQNNVVAVGWSELDFTQFHINSGELDIEHLRSRLKEKFYSDTDKIDARVLGRKLNTAQRFCQIKKGDYIIVPYYNQILLAVSTGEFLYDKNASEHDLSNQLRVEYQKISSELKTVPRNNLSEALQRRLRAQGLTVANLNEFREEMEHLFADEDPSYAKNLYEKDNYLTTEFKTKLLQNICSGKTGLETGGVGLENLIRELLECEGYAANICSKRKFKSSGDADVEAVRTDKFYEVKLLVQAKHHSGYSNQDGINQLLEISKETKTYDDYLMVFVTTATIDDELREYGEKNGIMLISGEEFVDWLYTHIDKLCDTTKMQLGISSAPQLC